MWNLPYPVEVQVCFSLAWLLYRFLLERDRAFGRNRGYLIGSAVLACVVPLLAIPVFPYAGAGGALLSADAPEEGAMFVGVERAEVAGWGVWFSRIYWCGVVLMAGRLLVDALRLWSLTRNASFVRIGRARIAYVECAGAAFSFFGRIYLDASGQGGKAEWRQVVRHEMCHVRLKHSWDRVFARLVLSLFWWNPFVWLWNRSLKEVHEFQADAAVLEGGCDSETYIRLLLRRLSGMPGLVSGFGCSLIRKRVAMIGRKEPGRRARWNILLALPLAGVMSVLFAFTEKEPPEDGPGYGRAVYRTDVPEQVGDVFYVEENNFGWTGGGILSGARGGLVKGPGTGLLDSLKTNYLDAGGSVRRQLGAFGWEHVVLFVDGVQCDPKMVARWKDGSIGRVFFVKSDRDSRSGKVYIETRNNGKYTAETAADRTGPFERSGNGIAAGAGMNPQRPPVFRNAGESLSDFRNYVMQRLRYPAAAAERGETGRVVVSFTVEADGNIGRVRVIDASSEEMSAEVVRAVESSPRWKRPGLAADDRPVATVYTLPVYFKC